MTASHPAPADLDRRLLGYLAGLHGHADLAAARIQQAVGLPLDTDPDNAQRYGFDAALEDDWACSLSTLPARRGAGPLGLVISYDDRRGRPGATVPRSAPAFAAFAEGLRASGYAHSPIAGPRGALWGHRFVRDRVELNVLTDREDPTAADVQLRVSRIVVHAAPQEAGHE
jgi:hypothetical protein